MNQKELANRLRQNPDALQSVLRSPDGQRLLQLLSGSDGGPDAPAGRAAG